jgi:hypothetical protein
MPKVPTFADDERVLCYHGPMLYEAKVRLTELRAELYEYLMIATLTCNITKLGIEKR